jgi:hypothetical protein
MPSIRAAIAFASAYIAFKGKLCELREPSRKSQPFCASSWPHLLQICKALADPGIPRHRRCIFLRAFTDALEYNDLRHSKMAAAPSLKTSKTIAKSVLREIAAQSTVILPDGSDHLCDPPPGIPTQGQPK